MLAKRISQIPAAFSDKVIVFAFPLLLIILNRNWIFTPATNFLPDPWFYFAYFRYFYDYAPVFPSNTYYFVERITWNVPGHYIYQIFPPLLANYVLHLTVCYIAIFSLYGILHTLFNRRAAVLSALVMSGYPWFLRAVGWDYVDGIGIALMLLLIYVLVKTRTSHHWKFLVFLAGIIHASLIVTNPFWVGFVPSWATFYLFINRPITREKSWRLFGEANYFILGNVALTVILALYYHSATGNYFFLQNSLAFAAQQAHDQNIINSGIVMFGRFPPYWHLLAILLAIATVWRTIRTTKDPYHHSFQAIGLLFSFAYGCLILWHYYSFPFLIVFSYSSFVIPFIFLLLGALLASIVEGLSNRQFTVILPITFLSLAAPFFLVVIFPFMENWQGNTWLILPFSLIFTLMISSPHKRIVLLPLLISLSALSFLLGLNSYVFISDPSKGQDNLLAITKASDAIDTYYPNHPYKSFRLWFREDKNYNTFFGLAAIYLYPWGSAIDRISSGKTPSSTLSIHKADELRDGDHIVILSSDLNAKHVMDEANRALATRNAIAMLESVEEIHEGTLHFSLYFTKVNVGPSK